MNLYEISDAMLRLADVDDETIDVASEEIQCLMWTKCPHQLRGNGFCLHKCGQFVHTYSVDDCEDRI